MKKGLEFMNKEQLASVNWLVRSGLDLIDHIVELDEGYLYVPNDIYRAFRGLNQQQKLEVIKESSEQLLARCELQNIDAE